MRTYNHGLLPWKPYPILQKTELSGPINRPALTRHEVRDLSETGTQCDASPVRSKSSGISLFAFTSPFFRRQKLKPCKKNEGKNGATLNGNPDGRFPNCIVTHPSTHTPRLPRRSLAPYLAVRSGRFPRVSETSRRPDPSCPWPAVPDSVDPRPGLRSSVQSRTVAASWILGRSCDYGGGKISHTLIYTGTLHMHTPAYASNSILRTETCAEMY